MPRTYFALARAGEELDPYDPYPEIRQILAPEFAVLPEDQLEGFVTEMFPGASPPDLESFLSQLGSFAQSALPVVRQALPVVGTLAGTAIGGPVGAAAGGFAGQLASQALGSATGPTPSRGTGRPATPPRPQPPVSAREPAPAQGQAPPQPPATSGAVPRALRSGGSPAAASLLQLLARPEILQALAAMAFGAAGRQQVAIGEASAPVGAVTNLLKVLADQASSEYHAATADTAGGTPAYLLDEAGEFFVDPMDPVQRAEALLMRFEQADALESRALHDEGYDDGDEEAWPDDDAMAADELDELYDQFERLELALDAELNDERAEWAS